ncbi:TPA: DUF645 family protein [Vibrio cholerae]|nr:MULTISPECIES: DUF645 family protein [Vibrio]MDP4497598.1 DUF645 family protein [Vibrio cholerae]WLP78967.1 DUF645 family protein [Vibrio cholerae]
MSTSQLLALDVCLLDAFA